MEARDRLRGHHVESWCWQGLGWQRWRRRPAETWASGMPSAGLADGKMCGLEESLSSSFTEYSVPSPPNTPFLLRFLLFYRFLSLSLIPLLHLEYLLAPPLSSLQSFVCSKCLILFPLPSTDSPLSFSKQRQDFFFYCLHSQICIFTQASLLGLDVTAWMAPQVLPTQHAQHWTTSTPEPSPELPLLSNNITFIS